MTDDDLALRYKYELDRQLASYLATTTIAKYTTQHDSWHQQSAIL